MFRARAVVSRLGLTAVSAACCIVPIQTAHGAAGIVLYIDSLPVKVDVGKKFTIDYHGRNLPAGSKLLLQRQRVRNGTYKTVTRLPAHQHSYRVTAPMSPNYYTYRIIVSKNGHELAATHGWGQETWGVVPFNTLLRSTRGRTQVDGQMYKYNYQREHRDNGRTIVIAGMAGYPAPCTWIKFTVALGDGAQGKILMERQTGIRRIDVPANSIVPQRTWKFGPNSSFTWKFRWGKSDPVTTQSLLMNGSAYCYVSRLRK